MIGWELAIVWVGWAIAGGSPGPATLGIISTSMNSGRKMGITFALGILTGGAFWGIAAALGMGALMMSHVWIFTAVKYIGAAYLLYLAIKSLRAAIINTETASGHVAIGTLKSVYMKGVLVHLTNPKAILSWGAIYSIVLPETAGFVQIFMLFGFLYSAGIMIFLGYAVLFSTQRAVQIYRQARRAFDLTFGLLFGAASLRILTLKP